MRKLDLLLILVTIGFLLNFAAVEARAQSDAQYLNDLAADRKTKLPFTLGDFVFENVYSICPLGCQTTYNSKYLAFNARTPNFLKQNVSIQQLSASLKPQMLSDYCSSATRTRNMGIVVYVVDRNRQAIGQVYVNPGDCPANTASSTLSTSTPTNTSNLSVNPNAQYLNTWVSIFGSKLPVTVGNVEITNVFANVASNYVEVRGWTPRLPIGQQRNNEALALKPSLLVDYCQSGAPQRNVRWLSSTYDNTQKDVYSYWINPADCLSNTTNTNITSSQTSSSVEEQYWDAVKSSQRSSDFQGYLNNYPNGQYAALARLRINQLGSTPGNSSNPTGTASSVEQQYWDAVKNSQQISDFQGYLDNYPNGQYVPIAKLKIGQLGGVVGSPNSTLAPNSIFNNSASSSNVEDQFWNSIFSSQNPQDYQRYLNSYPNGKYASLAQLRINQLSGSSITASNPNSIFSQPPIPMGTNNQSRGDAILAKAQIGSINEMLGLKKFWIITEGGDLDSKQIINDELLDDYPQLTAATSEQDADFYLLFAMVDQATGAKIVGNASSPNQTQVGEMLVFRSLPSTTGLPNIRIVFRTKKTRVFNNYGGSFNRHPATNATREFTKELKNIKF